IRMIFEPVRPRRVGPFTIQGLFLKRQPEVAGGYAEIIADDVVTMSNIADDLMNGPDADRTRQLIESSLRPAIDRALGRARPAARIAVGSHGYDAIRSSLAAEAADYAVRPLADAEFNARQREGVREFVATRVRAMGPTEFSEMLRTAVQEDEWLLYLH